MSRKDFQGATYAFAKFMADAAAEIARGERKGADRKWQFPHRKIRHINRHIGHLFSARFGKSA